MFWILWKLSISFWFHPEKLIERVRCWSPFLRLLILPDGDTRQCLVRSDYGATGNLNVTSVMDAWNSQEMQRQREEIRCHQNKCICWTQDTAFNAMGDDIPIANKFPIWNKRKEPSIKNKVLAD